MFCEADGSYLFQICYYVCFIKMYAGVMELADVTDSKSSCHFWRFWIPTDFYIALTA